MNIKNFTKVLLLILILLFALIKPSFCVLAGSRTIDMTITGIQDVDSSELYVLYPTEYIEFLYAKAQSQITYFTENEKNTYLEIGTLINNGQYIEAIKLETDFIILFPCCGDIEDTYYEENGLKYIKEKFTPECYGREVLEEFYEENTIKYKININYYYTKTNFKLLVVDQGNQTIIDLSPYNFEKLNFGIDNYSMEVITSLESSTSQNTTKHFTWDPVEPAIVPTNNSPFFFKLFNVNCLIIALSVLLTASIVAIVLLSIKYNKK